MDFNIDETNGLLALADDISSLEDTVVGAMVNLSTDTVTAVIDGIAEDLANPQQIFTNLASSLGDIAGAFGDLSPIFDKMDEIAANAPDYIRDFISQETYITLNITVLVDLCKLFGIGGVSNGKLTLKADEAVFFPLAVIAWVAVYMHNGSSISSVNDLDADLSLSSGEVGASGGTLWNLVRLAADGVLTELGGIAWFLKSLTGIYSNTNPTSIEKLFKGVGVYFNFIRWINDTIYTVKTWLQSPNTLDYYTTTWVFSRMLTAFIDIYYSRQDDKAAGWPKKPKKTDITHCINALLNVAIIAINSSTTAASSPNSTQTASLVGRDLVRSQTLFTFLYNFFFAPTKNEAALFLTMLIVLALPYGFELQILAMQGALSAPPPGPGNSSPGPGRRRRRRRRPHGTGPKNRGNGSRRRW